MSTKESTTNESAEGLAMMSDAAQELGVAFSAPVVPKAPPAAADDNETEEERLAREEAGVDENGDKPEDREEEGETEGEEGAEGEDKEEAEEQKEETAEEKAAREKTEAEEAAKDPATKEKAEAAAIVALKLKDLPEAVRKRAQAVIDEVVGRVVAKERGETERLGSRVTELTQELEATQKQKGPTIVGAINPAFLADSEDELSTRVEQIEKFERWARKHENGFEGDAAKGEQSFTAEQIEARLEELIHEKNKIIPAARKNLQTRAIIDQNLRIVYPAIYDPKSAEYAQANQVLKALPELKQFADWRVIALKQILGDRALAELLTKQKESKPAGQQKQESGAPKKPAPRAPGAGSPAKGSVLSRPGSKPAAAAAVEKFTKGEGTLEDAVGALI